MIWDFLILFWKWVLEKLIGWGRERGRGGGGRAESDACKSVTRAAAGDATACSCGGCRAEARWGWTRRGPCSRWAALPGSAESAESQSPDGSRTQTPLLQQTIPSLLSKYIIFKIQSYLLCTHFTPN